MADIEKVINALERCTNAGNGCFECPYSDDGFHASIYCKLQIDRDALELLKEQEAIVRCKDCKHYTFGVSGLDGYCEEWMRKTDGNEFFCADGERRTE